MTDFACEQNATTRLPWRLDLILGSIMPRKTKNIQTLIESIETLLHCASGLRRDDCQNQLDGWTGAVKRVLAQFDDSPIAPTSTASEAMLAANSAVRRLADSGDARCASASVGRKPDSSLAGRRFNDDVERVMKCLKRLRELSHDPD